MNNNNALDHSEIIVTYWNERWKAQGYRGGVSVFQTVDEKYIERNRRDEARLNEALIYIKRNKFYIGAEIGAGAGRMTSFYQKMVRHLVCFDISEQAKTHFRSQGFNNDYHITPISEIGSKYADMFDFAVSFTVVQHIHGIDEFIGSLKSIQDSLKLGGIYLLHEDISASVQKKNPAPHMNGFSQREYESALDKCANIYAKTYHYDETNEDDLVAIYERIR